MIASCIDRMSRNDCGGCERRDACTSLFKMLRFDNMPKCAPARPAERSSVPQTNPFMTLLGAVAKAIEGKVATPKKSEFRSEVERRVEPMLVSGPVRVDAVARSLGCSRQTLYRRLKAEGITFAELLNGVRRRLALRFVREQGLPVKEAAWRLGFSDPAAFSRAFKRWTGTSPSEARGKDRN